MMKISAETVAIADTMWSTEIEAYMLAPGACLTAAWARCNVVCDITDPGDGTMRDDGTYTPGPTHTSLVF